MAKKLNELNTIDEAKSAEYNGKTLTRDEDKNIFDNDLLNTSGTIDSTKLRQTAQLLEKALKAKEATSKNSALLTELKTAKTSNGVDYQVAKSQVDGGIVNLEILEGSQDSNIQAIIKELQEKNAALKNAKKNLEEKESEAKAFISDISKLQIKYDKAKKRREGIDKLVEKLTRVAAPTATGLTTTQIAEKWDETGINILNSMVDRNKHYVDNFYKTANWIETSVDYFEGRKFVCPEHFIAFIFKYIDLLRELDESALKTSIDGLSSVSADDKKKAKEAFSRLKNAKYVKSSEYTSYPKEYSMIDGTNLLEKDGIDLAKRIIEKETSVIAKYKTDDSWPFNSKDEKANRVKFSDLFTFMKIVFPRGSYINSPLLDSSNGLCLKLADGTDISGKKYKIKWRGEQSRPSEVYTTDDVFKKIGFAEADFNWTSKSGLVKLFWDAFKNDNDLNVVSDDDKSHYFDQDGNKQAREITNFEWDHQLWRNRIEDLRITMAFYVAHIKKIVEEAKDESGKPLELTFDDGWRETAFKVALSARNTSAALLDKLFEDANKKKDKSLWKINLEGTKNELAVYKATYHVRRNFEVSLYEDFRSESIIREKESELELKGEEIHLGKLTSEKNDLKAKVRQAELEQGLAQKKLDNAQGKTLEQLKENFIKIYGSGPGTKKYKWGELREMRDILELIIIKEGSLDSVYTGYKDELQTKVYDAISEWFTVTSDWLNAEESLEKRIIVRKKNNIYYTDEKRTQELENLRSCFDNIANVRELSPVESNERKRIDDFLNGNIQLPEDDQTSDLDESKLGTIFNFVVEKALLDKWKASVDGKTLKEEDIKRIVGAYSKNTDSAKFTALTSHLSEKGVVDGGKITGATPEEIWKKFLEENEPSIVIKTIVTHENEDVLKDSPDATKRNAIIERMKGTGTYYDTDPEKNRFDKEKYGNPEEPDTIDKDKLFAFLYAEKLGNISQRSTAWKTTTGGDNTDNDNEKQGWKDWFLFREGNIWKPTITYLGIFLAIVGVAAVIFWKNISDWWNGPADEQGEGETGEEEKEENE